MRGRWQGVCIGAMASVFLLPSGAFAAPSVVERVAEQSAAEVREYWTPERMAEAKPLDLAQPIEALPDVGDLRELAPVGKRRSVSPSRVDYAAVTQTNTTAPGIRTHGKIFFSVGPNTFVCSGTVVNSPNGSIVWTAGHCIYDSTSNSIATNFVFVPGYNVGAEPFGEWAARNAFVPSNYVGSDGADSRDDVGALLMEIKKRAKTPAEKRRCNRFKNRRKRRRCKRQLVNVPIQDKVGARGIVFNQDPSLHTYNAFGYPANPTPRFDGEHLELCVSAFTGVDGFFPEDPKPISISCDMQGGASGGGWVISGGRVNGNVSYGYPNFDPNHFFSPYFDSFTKGFYDAVKSRTG